MARIEGVPENRAGLVARFIYRKARRRLGKVPTPVAVVAHHPNLPLGYGMFELAQQRSRLVNLRLKSLAQLKAATLIGCLF